MRRFFYSAKVSVQRTARRQSAMRLQAGLGYGFCRHLSTKALSSWFLCTQAAPLLRPPFALEHLQQLDAEHLVYHSPKPHLRACGDLVLTPLELNRRPEGPLDFLSFRFS